MVEMVALDFLLLVALHTVLQLHQSILEVEEDKMVLVMEVRGVVRR